MRKLSNKENIPTNLYVALVTSANVPDADTNILSDLTEITAGNGYTSGGFQLDMNSTDFDVITEDDTNAKLKKHIKQLAIATETLNNAAQKAQQSMINFGKAYDQLLFRELERTGKIWGF